MPPVLRSSHRSADQQAQAEQLKDPDAARELWERLHGEMVDEAPLVPLVAWNAIDVLCKRVGNYQYSASGMGLLIDQLWVQ